MASFYLASSWRAIIEKHRDIVCEEAELSQVDKKLLWRRQFLNPYSGED